jgi:hypothetical protein
MILIWRIRSELIPRITYFELWLSSEYIETIMFLKLFIFMSSVDQNRGNVSPNRQEALNVIYLIQFSSSWEDSSCSASQLMEAKCYLPCSREYTTKALCNLYCYVNARDYYNISNTYITLQGGSQFKTQPL